MQASKMLQAAVLGLKRLAFGLWLQQVRVIVRHLDEMAEPIPRVSASHAIHLELGIPAGCLVIEHTNLRTRDLTFEFDARHTGDLPVLFWRDPTDANEVR